MLKKHDFWRDAHNMCSIIITHVDTLHGDDGDHQKYCNVFLKNETPHLTIVAQITWNSRLLQKSRIL